ncbi:unnamed protein product [Sympodiomycopsis kandeliae]
MNSFSYSKESQSADMSEVEMMQMESGPSRLSSPHKHNEEDAHSSDDLDLDSLIPGPGSEGESEILRRLRSMAARPLAYSEARPGNFTSLEHEGFTELSWQGNRLVWRRSCQVMRTFSFDQDVVAACWAWMGKEADQHKLSGTEDNSQTHGISPPVHESNLDHGRAFGPAQIAFRADLAGTTSSSSHASGSASELAKSRRHKALVIALTATVVIFYPRTGQEFTLMKDFKLKEMLPAPSTGVLFHRAPEADDLRIASDAESESSILPTLFYLGDPLDEYVPVPVLTSDVHVRVQWHGDGPQDNSFANINEILKPVAIDHAPHSFASCEILVSYDATSGNVRIYAVAKPDRYPHIPRQSIVTKASQDVEMSFADQLPAPSDPIAQARAQTQTQTQSSPIGRPLPLSRPSFARAESFSGTRATETVGKGRPQLMPRRSSRLSSFAPRDASVSAATPMLRRRSSRFASNAEKTTNMARIEESFSQPTQSAHSANAPTAVSAEVQQRDDAEEAEEMGQLVEGLARRQEDHHRHQNDPTTADHRLGAAFDLARASSGTMTGQRRTSSMIRTPYVPASSGRAMSGSMHRRRSSRHRAESDLDPNSFFNTTNVTGVPNLVAANADDTRDTIATHHFMPQPEHLGRNAQSVPSALNNSRTLTLELLETIDSGILDAQARFHAFLHPLYGSRDQAVLNLSVPGRLIARRLSLVNPHASFGRIRSDQMPGLEPHPHSRDVVPVAIAGSVSSALLSLDSLGNLNLTLPEDAAGSQIALAVRPCTHSDIHNLVTCSSTDNAQTGWTALSPLPGKKNVFLLSKGDESSVACSLDLQAHDPLVCEILTALEIVFARSGGHTASKLRRAWALSRLQQPVLSEWQTLITVLIPGEGLSETVSASDEPWSQVLANAQGMRPRASVLPQEKANLPINSLELRHTLLTLNAIAEDKRLQGLVASELKIAKLIKDILISHQIRESGHELSWPSMLSLFLCILRGELTNEQAFIDQLFPSLHIPTWEAQHFLSHTLAVCKTLLPHRGSDSLHSIVDGKELLSADQRAAVIVQGLVQAGLGRTQIQTLPLALSTIIQHALDACKANPPKGLSSKAYKLIGRDDLVKQMQPRHEDHGPRFSRSALRSLPKGAAMDAMSAMLFPKDQRLQDVLDMLLTVRPTVVRAPSKPDKTDEENHREGLSRLQNVAEKIKATPIGRGMFLMLTRRFDPAIRWHTPRINLKIVLRPPQPYQFSEPRPNSSELDWPEFHNGVASALEMANTQGRLNSIWYFSQGAGGRTPRHAGLLLGLGLAGRFEEIGQVHAFRYLVDRHDLTSIGLLLGLAATFAGRGDQGVRSLLACHIKAFLPPGSANLAHSTLVQCAALLGTGLLFLGTDVSHMTESLMEQIGEQNIETTNLQTFSRETYSLSAGLGAGLVMLGRGRRTGMSTVRDKRLLRKLERLIEGPPERLFEEKDHDPTWKVDERITSVPAVLAYALIFLRSNNADAASRIPMPQTLAEIDNMRPHSWLIMSLAYCLIMWDEIQPSDAWIANRLPEFLHSVNSIESCDSVAVALAADNIQAGACFALSLKYAGTGNPLAKRLLMDRYRHFDQMSKVQSKQDYDGRISQNNARAIADQLALCLATVLAGSGDLEVLKFLRVAHGQRPGHDPYGSHMAIHMALGLLFLGGGRYTLGSSDASIAALLIAFYPRFPTRCNDNRSHLQAFRHLWFLAVEPRLVLAQDVDSDEVVFVPVTCRGRNESQERRATLPSRIPDLHRLSSVTVKSDRYWPLKIDLKASGQHSMAQAMTVFVKAKPDYYSYLKDPQGHKTAMKRASRRYEAAMHKDKVQNLLDQEAGGPGLAGSRKSLTNGHEDQSRGCDSLDQSLYNLPKTLKEMYATAAQSPGRIQELMWLPRFAALLPLVDQDNKPATIRTSLAGWRDNLRQQAVDVLDSDDQVVRDTTNVLKKDQRGMADVTPASVMIAILTPAEMRREHLRQLGVLARELRDRLRQSSAPLSEGHDSSTEAVVRVLKVAVRNLLGHDQDEVHERLLRLMAES